jgi:hypothetical protein
MPSPRRGRAAYDRSVFINCPFDPNYQPLFRAIVFAVEDCGFLARCALEVEDSGEVRVNKIIKIIKGCGFGIHDISRTELNPEGLPRFNMPYELGLFIGCAVFADGPHRNKKALILDRERHRYEKYISDIAGQDIQEHGDNPERAIKKVRNWLASHSRNQPIPGGDVIIQRFNAFCLASPEICEVLQLADSDLENYRDYQNCVANWLNANARQSP